MKHPSEAEPGGHLGEILDAAERGERTVVVRDGRPVAVVAPFAGEADSRPDLPKAKRPGGLLAAVGLLSDWDTMAEDMAEVIAMRQTAIDRPPPDFE